MESQLPDPSHSLMELTTTPQSQGVVSRNHDLVDLHRELPTAFPLDDYERMREQTGRVGQEMKIGEEESEVQEVGRVRCFRSSESQFFSRVRDTDNTSLT